MIGTGCSGTNAVRYGTARAEWFLNVVSRAYEEVLGLIIDHKSDGGTTLRRGDQNS